MFMLDLDDRMPQHHCAGGKIIPKVFNKCYLLMSIFCKMVNARTKTGLRIVSAIKVCHRKYDQWTVCAVRVDSPQTFNVPTVQTLAVSLPETDAATVCIGMCPTQL